MSPPDRAKRLEVQLCGALNVRLEGRAVDLRRTARAGRLVLAYLLLNRGRPVTREELMEHVWVEPDPQRVAGSLTQTLSRLRQNLGADVLQRLPNRAVRLHADIRLDVELAEVAFREGREAFDRGEWERARQAADTVLSYLRGEILAGDEAEWLGSTRRRALERRVDALELRSRAALAAGELGDAEAAARDVVDADDRRESAWALLIEAQAAQGKVAQGTETFHEVMARLRDRYGLTPSPRLLDLHQRVLERSLSSESSVGPAVGAAGGLPARLQQAARPRFVGRLEERRRLSDAWRRARQSGSGLVVVNGEPGIGKTRLTAHLAVEAERDGATVLYGSCEEDVGTPYLPWIDVVTQCVEAASRATVERNVQAYGTVLARLVPGLAGRVTGSAAASSDPEAERYLLFGAVCNVLCEASTDRPVLLVLDDLQWADKPTLLLLRHLVTSGRPMRMLVVAAYRSSDVADALAELLAAVYREPGTERIALGGLGLSDFVALIEVAAARQLTSAEHALAGELRTETGGNPFFLVQLLRHLVESGAIASGPEGWRLTHSLSATALPDTVREVIARRVLRLGEQAAGVLRIAAVIGREFDLDVLAQVAGQSEDGVLEILAEAERARLISEVGSARFAFAHALVNHALSQELGRTRRERLHRRVADALERLGDDGPRLGQVAHHRLAARTDAKQAIEAAERAGRWALAQLAPDEAARWFREALALLDPEDPTQRARRCELLIRLGEAQRHAGDRAYRGTLLDAAALARDLGDAERLARAAVANSRGFESASGNVDAERVDVLEAALALLGDSDAMRRARLLAQLQLEQTFVRELAERRRLSDEAVALAEATGDAETLAHVLWARHAVLWTPDLLGEHCANAARLEAVAGRLNDPVTTFWAACDVVLTSLWSADIRRVDEGLATMDAIADRVGQPILRWIRLWYGSWRAYLAGGLAEAQRLAVEAASVGIASGQPDAEAFRADQLMPITWDLGRLGEAIPLLEAQLSAHPGLPVFRAWLALAYCEGERPADARRELASALAGGFRDVPWDILWLTTACLYAEVCTRLSAPAEATLLAGILAPYRDHLAFNASSVLGSVAHFLGGLAATAGDWRSADAHFARAAAVHDALGAAGLLARTRCEWGLALLDCDAAAARERGAALLAQGRADCERIGMAGMRRRVAALDLAVSQR